jgi:hypothetical protein
MYKSIYNVLNNALSMKHPFTCLITLLFHPFLVYMGGLLVQHNHEYQYKKQDEWYQNEEPRYSTVTIFAHQVQYPCPENDIDYFNDKDGNATGYIARKTS